MVGDILKIKTRIPPPGANILSLPRVLERLEDELHTPEGFARSLTLVSAPAGFGKTTLVRKWLDGRPGQVAWFSLDEGDNEPQRFWVYLISALENLHEGVGRGALEMLRSQTLFSSPSSAGEGVLVSLLNDLFALVQPLFLVLDDYHLINNPRIHQEMIFFIENAPPTLHLAVTTRSDPPWPLSRWRAKGKMAEIRLRELQFSEEEAGRLLEGYKNIQLGEAQLQTLHQKTEGWVTGLQLAAISLSTGGKAEEFIQSFAGSHRHVLNFLSEEVLARQSEGVRDFLMETSILTRFSAPLCNAVTGRQDSHAVLAELERENIFLIPLDEEGIWYRYHQLFADLLLYHLKRKVPEKMEELHTRAGQWYLEAGEPGEAVRHALAHHDFEKAGEILHRHYEEILQDQGPGLLLYRNLELLPPAVLKGFPRLAAHMALFQLITRGREKAREFLEMAEELSYPNPKEQEEYGGILAAVKAYFAIYAHRFPQALEHAEKALRLLPPHSHYWRMNVAIYFGDAMLFSGNPKEAYPFYREAHRNSQKLPNQVLSLTSGFKVATSLYYRGRLKEGEELTQSLLRTAKEVGLSRVPRVGLLWTLLGELLREKGHLDEAQPCFERGLIFSEPEKPCLGWNYLFQIALSFSQRDYEEALQTIRLLEELHREVHLPLFITFPAAVWEGRILLEQGELDRARERLQRAGIEEGAALQGGQEWGYLALARWQVEAEKGGAAAARRLLKELIEFALPREHQQLLLETLLVKTRLEEKEGAPGAAEDCLLSALEAGLEGGYAQIFLEESRGLSGVFSRVIEKMENPHAPTIKEKIREGARELYGRISPGRPPDRGTEGKEEESEKGKKVAATPQGDLVEELSPREMEVLNLISQGLSNDAIAKELFLSLGTVKWHTTNIYGKLGVRGRTQAVALARKLNMIP